MSHKKIFLKKVQNISKQFLCNFPLLYFEWQNIFDVPLTENQQEYLLNKTVNSKVVLKYPVKINYQKLFLKHVLDKLEKQESVIHDDVYLAYGRLVAAGDGSGKDYKHYLLDDDIENETQIITLKESNHLILEGTTGLRTWQASLALSEWIILNKTLFDNKTVLELGSGIGLTGLVLNRTCQPKCVYLTDCHQRVLDNLCENININISNKSQGYKEINNRTSFASTNLENRCLYTCSNSSSVSILNLPWEDFSSDICQYLGSVEKVIAADIVYDKDLFLPLANAITCLKTFCNVEEFIFSCTERNLDTIQNFLTLMRTHFRHVEQLTTPEQSTFVWPNDTPVKIFIFKD